MQRRPRRLSARWLLASGLLLAAGCSDRLPLEPMADAPHGPSFSESVNLQATPPGYIRIGVVPSATSVRIGAAGAFTIKNKATGATLFSGSDGEATVTLLTSGTVDTRMWLQTACAGVTARDAWLAKAAALGYETRTEFVPAANCYRLQLGTLNQGWSARVAFRNQAISDGLAGSDSFWKSVTIVYGDTQIQITYNGSGRVVDAPVVLTSDGGIVTINGKPYRGLAEVWTNSSGALAGINELRIEEYLYGVVPNELPPRVWPQMEAQKSQAVAARTFAIRRLGNRAADGYDVLPTQTDQVYRGLSSEHPISTQAVNETAGVVATHNGRLIESVYSSTAGGFTADNEESFASDPIPYLRGIPDSERGAAFQNVPTVEVFKNAKNATLLRTYQPANYEDEDWSRYYRWRGDWTAEEMSRVISLYAGKDVGRVLEINALERGRSGRIIEIEYVTEQGTFRATKFGIRTSLQFVNENGTLSPLFSTLFFIEPVVDPKTREITGWTAYGGGWGHGVGLSQTGAASRADKGQTYEAILKHYYQGITLETRTY
jgi:stage II sporulation protein D